MRRNQSRRSYESFNFVHDELVKLVDDMLKTQNNRHAAGSEAEKEHWRKMAGILDERTRALVYGLYGLTEEEIKIVEGER